VVISLGYWRSTGRTIGPNSCTTTPAWIEGAAPQGGTASDLKADVALFLGRRLTSVVKEREFSAHASQEKGRFARTAKQAESLNHDAREGKAASVGGSSAEIIRHSER